MEFVILGVILVLFGGIIILPSVRENEQKHVRSLILWTFRVLLVAAFCSITFSTNVEYGKVDVSSKMPLVSMVRTNKEICYSYLNSIDEVVTASAPSESSFIHYVELWDSPHMYVISYKREKSFFFLDKELCSIVNTYDTHYLFYISSNLSETF